MRTNQIHIIYGKNGLKIVKELLENINLVEELKPGMMIGIKPNLINTTVSEEGATTSPWIVEGIIKYLQNNGHNNIKIMEGSWVGADTEKAFKICGYKKLADKYGVELVNLKKDDYLIVKVRDLELKICEQPLAVDYLINVPVLKAHCQTRFTCALKNLKGCIPDTEKRRYHSLGLHKPIAYLNKVLKADLIIVDAIIGDLTFEEGGNPVEMDRIIIGRDPVLIDSYGASLIGYTKDEIDYIKIAESICVGNGNLDKAEIIEYNKSRQIDEELSYSPEIEQLKKKVNEDEACSACLGSLLHALQRLKEEGYFKKINNIYIGQGYKSKKLEGIGIGNCTKNFNTYVKGCPPSAQDIREKIKSMRMEE